MRSIKMSFVSEGGAG